MKISLERKTLVNVIKIPIDIVEDSEGYLVVADMPGLDRDSIEISGTEDSITIKALRQEKYSGKYLLMERAKGVMSRSIRFKKMVNLGKAKAVYQDGILKIYIPKAKDEFIIDSCFKIVIL